MNIGTILVTLISVFASAVLGFLVWKLERFLVRSEKERRLYDAGILQLLMTTSDLSIINGEFAKANGSNGNTEAAIIATRAARTDMSKIVNDRAVS